MRRELEHLLKHQIRLQNLSLKAQECDRIDIMDEERAKTSVLCRRRIRIGEVAFHPEPFAECLLVSYEKGVL